MNLDFKAVRPYISSDSISFLIYLGFVKARPIHLFGIIMNFYFKAQTICLFELSIFLEFFTFSQIFVSEEISNVLKQTYNDPDEVDF